MTAENFNLMQNSFQSLGMRGFEFFLDELEIFPFCFYRQERMVISKVFVTDDVLSMYLIVAVGKPMSDDVKLSCFPIGDGDLWHGMFDMDDIDSQDVELNPELVKLVARLNDGDAFDVGCGKFLIDSKRSWRYDLEIKLNGSPSVDAVRWAIWRMYVVLAIYRRELDAVAFNGASLETCGDDDPEYYMESLKFLRNLSVDLGDPSLFTETFGRELEQWSVNDVSDCLDDLTESGDAKPFYRGSETVEEDDESTDDGDLAFDSKDGYDGFLAEGDGESSGYDGFLAEGDDENCGYDGFLNTSDDDLLDCDLDSSSFFRAAIEFLWDSRKNVCDEEENEEEDENENDEDEIASEDILDGRPDGDDNLSRKTSEFDFIKSLRSMSPLFKQILDEEKSQEEGEERRVENTPADGENSEEKGDENEGEEDEECENDG